MSSVTIPDHVRGLVFDCDGTIADTMPLHYQAWVSVLAGHDCDFPEALFYEMGGIKSPQIVETLNERHGYSLPVEETARRKEELFEAMIPRAIPIEPIVSIVRENFGRRPMAVATGGTRAICSKTLDALGLLRLFDAVVTADDVQHGKPAPDVFLEAARRLIVPPDLCMAFEDAELGLQAARAAGMLVVDIRSYRA